MDIAASPAVLLTGMGFRPCAICRDPTTIVRVAKRRHALAWDACRRAAFVTLGVALAMPVALFSKFMAFMSLMALRWRTVLQKLSVEVGLALERLPSPVALQTSKQKTLA